ncbi:hypothetical protein EC973_000985 [Apophysomyces ossiformis]|uniref:Endoplasmic reticulum vesicle transporter C-terminal domain-containing protein n=1 Tax=Apophysomyces ossiformis TaxID=679940 RepID=A0A8H7BIH4_9FUNG|nr:hypothetical protein EC973_000985 [Apophysomyces ossiformis]
MPCINSSQYQTVLSLDVMDEGDQHVTGYEHDVFKVRLDASGNEIEKDKPKELSNSLKGAELALRKEDDGYCGPCYGASPKAGQCCNSCEEVEQLYAEQGWAFNPDIIEQCIKEGWREKMESQSTEGCNMHGQLLVSKARGNIHFSPGKAISHGSSHVHDVRAYLLAHHDFVHEIHHLQFGNQDHQAYKQKRTKMNALTNPLDGTMRDKANPALMYQYHLKIVPTQVNYVSGYVLDTFQYSVSRQERDLSVQPTGGLPGGIFTVASMVDGALYRAERSLKKKTELGKMN